MHTRQPRALMGLAVLVPALLAGCSVYVPAQRTVVATRSEQVVLPATGAYTASTVYVPAAPPPVQEVVTVRPAVGMIWTPGIWVWAGSRHVWRPGRWAYPRHVRYYSAPRPYYRVPRVHHYHYRYR